MKNKKFNIVSYNYLLKIIKKSNRKIITFDDFFKGKNGIMLRHDIDFSLSKALEIAKIENNRGIISTFFVLLNSKMYNLFKQNNVKYLKKIMLLGHQLGLHFDASKYNKDLKLLNKSCREECKVLENLINKKIKIISFHRPQKKLIGKKNKIAERYHTYMPELIHSTKYCSDSGGSWSYDDPEELIFDKSIKNIQLLTHPIWWTTPENLSPGEKIDFYLSDAQENIKKEAAENCIPYKRYLKTISTK